MEPRIQVRVAGEGLHNGFLVAYNTGLDPLRQPGTAVRFTALPLPGVLGTQLTVHILCVVLECVDIQKVFSFPGDGKGRTVQLLRPALRPIVELGDD